jgi:hypothetical protein
MKARRTRELAAAVDSLNSAATSASGRRVVRTRNCRSSSRWAAKAASASRCRGSSSALGATSRSRSSVRCPPATNRRKSSAVASLAAVRSATAVRHTLSHRSAVVWLLPPQPSAVVAAAAATTRKLAIRKDMPYRSPFGQFSSLGPSYVYLTIPIQPSKRRPWKFRSAPGRRL